MGGRDGDRDRDRQTKRRLKIFSEFIFTLSRALKRPPARVSDTSIPTAYDPVSQTQGGQ